MRHSDSLARSKEQEYEEHVEVESRIKSRCKDVVVSRPERILVPVEPVHDDKPADKSTDGTGAKITVETGQTGEEDGRVPEMEFGVWESSVKSIDEEWDDEASEEAVWDGFKLL